MFKIVMNLLFIALFSISVRAHFGSKGPFGGTVSCTTIAGDTVYMGTAEGGVYESTSAALIGWRARPVGLKSGKITAIAHTGIRLYAATADSGIFILNGYVGTDRYWNKVNTGLTNLHVTSLVAINATTLMAGTTTGLYVTTNSGTSWTAINAGLTHLTITAIEKAGTRIFCTVSDGGVYYTENNGTSWIDFNDINTDGIAGTMHISYNATNNQLLLLNKTGLFVTGDARTASKANFSFVSNILTGNPIISDVSNDGNNWYVATDKGMFVANATTFNWTDLNTGLATNNVKTVEPFKNGLVCGTATKGIYKAALPFTTWTAMNANFNNLKTQAMYTNGTAFVAVATENGVFVSKDLAANYTAANKGLEDSLFVTDLTMAGSLLIAATNTNGIYISLDSGMNWSRSNAGLTSLNIKKLFYSNAHVYAIDASNNVVKTAIPSINWTVVQLPSNVIPTSLLFFGNNIALTTYGKGVFVKSLSATSWVSTNSGLTNLNVTSSTTLGANIYIGTDGAGVFVSDNAVTSIQWSAAASTAMAISHTSLMNLDGLKIQAMATGAGYVWASYKGGLLASSTQGDSWIAGGNQFNLPSFTDVNKITFVDTRVFVSTENNGLYSNALSEIPTVIPTGIVTTNHVDIATLQVVPNPSTGAFILNTEGVFGKITEIVIYDYSGKIKERFTGAKTHFDLNYEPGMYVVLVSTEAESVYSQKIIIK